MVDEKYLKKGLIFQIIYRIRTRGEKMDEASRPRRRWQSIFFCKDHKQIYVLKGKIERNLYLIEGFFKCGCPEIIFALSCEEEEYKELIQNNQIKNVIEKALEIEKKMPNLQRYPHKPLDELLRSIDD